MKWLSPQEYADLVGKSRQWVYLQIQLGRLKNRKVKSKEMILEVAYEEGVDSLKKEPNLG